MRNNNRHHRSILQDIAHQAMLDRDLPPDFSGPALAEANKARSPVMDQAVPDCTGREIRDLRSLLWASIDNDDSLDLDQLTVAEAMPAITQPRSIPRPRSFRCCQNESQPISLR